MTRDDETVRSTVQKRDAKGVIRHGAEWLALWADPDSMKSTEELQSDRDAARAHAAFEKYLAATTRALSAKSDLSVTFVAGDRSSGTGLALNHIPRTLDARAISAARGEADSKALFLRYHDTGIHHRNAPTDHDHRRLYDLCERVRCEALGARRFFGIEQNLIAHQLDRLRKMDLLNAHLASLIPLEQGLQMVLRDSLVGRDDPSVETSGFWMWDRWLRDRFTSHFEALYGVHTDQDTFGQLSAQLIKDVLAEVGSIHRRNRPERTAKGSWQPDELGDESRLKEEHSSGEPLQPGGTLFVDEDVVPQLESVASEQAEPMAYQVFSREHDLVARAESLAAKVELRDVRETLDKKRAQFRRELSRLTTRLQRKLMARQVRAWSFDQDEGLIDAARLDRVIVNPGFASAYKQELETDFPDSAVTILIDNSGSMRGKTDRDRLHRDRSNFLCVGMLRDYERGSWVHNAPMEGRTKRA